MLDVLSLGLNSYKDSTYVNIASGHGERISSLNTILILFIILHLLVIGVIRLVSSIKGLKAKHRVLIEETDRQRVALEKLIEETLGREPSKKPSAIPTKESETKVDESIQTALAKTKKAQTTLQSLPFRKLNVLASVFVFLALFLFANFAADFARMAYANNAIVYFNQVLEISAPFLSEEERKSVRSRFAQVKNRQDYVELLSFLQARAYENQQSVPAFNIW